MFTNIKYIIIFLVAILVSIKLFGVNPDIISGHTGDDEPEKITLNFKTLFWQQISADNLDKVKAGDLNKFYFHDISVEELIEFLAQHKNHKFVGGSLNSIRELEPLPGLSTIRNLTDPVLLESYNIEIQRRMNLLHLLVDAEAGITNGYTFEWLYKSDSPEQIGIKFEQANNFIIEGHMEYWVKRFQELIKSGEISKKNLKRKIKESNLIGDSISPPDYIPYSESKIQNPVYTNLQFNTPRVKQLNWNIYASTYKIQSGKGIPIIEISGKSHTVISNSKLFIEGLTNYTDFRSFHQFKNIERNLLQSSDRIFVQLEGLVSEVELSSLRLIHSRATLYISYLGIESNKFAEFENVIWHNEINATTRELAAQIFFGGIIPNKQAIRLSFNKSNPGFDKQTLDKIDRLIVESINDSIFPGAQILISKNGEIVYNKQFGFLTYSKRIPVKPNTMYDLASITKVLATVPAIMVLDSLSVIEIDAKISTYLPEVIGSNKENMTIKDILSHQAGLYPYWPFWKNTMTMSGMDPYYYQANSSFHFEQTGIPGSFQNSVLPDSIWQWTLDLKLNDRHDSSTAFDYVYSDMGFYMLKKLTEKYLKQPLDSFALNNFFKPLGMGSTSFLPINKYSLDQIAPTEFDLLFRGKLVHGSVHDQTAAMLGGVAGHAGLFSNAMDLAKFLEMFRKGTYGGKRYFSDALIKKYTSQQYPNNRRALGWDKKDKEGGGNTSYHASPESFGHTGFSGTSAWVDPEFELIYVFLSNRIHPDAENFKIVEYSVRTRVHDIIYEAMWNFERNYGCK